LIEGYNKVLSFICPSMSAVKQVSVSPYAQSTDTTGALCTPRTMLALASPSIICNDKSHDQQTPYNSTVVIRNRQQSY